MDKVTDQIKWESTYSSPTCFHKNSYPNECIIRFARRNYYNIANKGEIRCLDLGCGWGNNLYFLRDEGFDCYGVDFSKTAIEHLKADFGDKVYCGGATRLQYADNFFDFMIDRASIQHNPREDVSLILLEVYRILKPGGKLFSTMLKQGPHDFLVTRLSEKELRKELSIFSSYEINYSSLTVNHGQDGHVGYIIEAIK